MRFGQFDAEFGGDLSGAGTGAVDPDPSVCSYNVSPLNPSVPASGGAFNVSVTTPAGCGGRPRRRRPGCRLCQEQRKWKWPVTLSAAANGGSARSGTATVAGQTVNVSQSGASTPPPAGNTCARPSNAPANTTAVCNDGFFSSSQNRSGTCSWHGGVKCWVCPGVLCNGLILDSFRTPQFLTREFILTPAIPHGSYADIESSVGALVGKVEVYKVHHHGSKFSSNATWLAATTPKVGIISASNSNSYGHPTAEALGRLHSAGTKTYWTSVGAGVPPLAGWDFVGGDIVVNVNPGSDNVHRHLLRLDAPVCGLGLHGTRGRSAATPPFGSFDTPTNGSTVTGEVGITGWALDNSGVNGVDIYRSPLPGEPVQSNGLVFLGSATMVTGAGSDIATTYAAYRGGERRVGIHAALEHVAEPGKRHIRDSAYVRSNDGANTSWARRPSRSPTRRIRNRLEPSIARPGRDGIGDDHQLRLGADPEPEQHPGRQVNHRRVRGRCSPRPSGLQRLPLRHRARCSRATGTRMGQWGTPAGHDHAGQWCPHDCLGGAG